MVWEHFRVGRYWMQCWVWPVYSLIVLHACGELKDLSFSWLFPRCVSNNNTQKSSVCFWDIRLSNKQWLSQCTSHNASSCQTGQQNLSGLYLFLSWGVVLSASMTKVLRDIINGDTRRLTIVTDITAADVSLLRKFWRCSRKPKSLSW